MGNQSSCLFAASDASHAASVPKAQPAPEEAKTLPVETDPARVDAIPTKTLTASELPAPDALPAPTDPTPKLPPGLFLAEVCDMAHRMELGWHPSGPCGQLAELTRRIVVLKKRQQNSVQRSHRYDEDGNPFLVAVALNDWHERTDELEPLQAQARALCDIVGHEAAERIVREVVMEADRDSWL
jgi:hypothetical protein